MSYVLIFISAFILGILACPIVIFLRARKCDEFADIVKSRPKER